MNLFHGRSQERMKNERRIKSRKKISLFTDQQEKEKKK